MRAIKELKADPFQLVLTADKEMAMVVMDREDYADKAQSLLADTNTYKTITKDPTNKLKVNFLTHSGTSKTKEDLGIIATEKCTHQCSCP